MKVTPLEFESEVESGQEKDLAGLLLLLRRWVEVLEASAERHRMKGEEGR